MAKIWRDGLLVPHYTEPLPDHVVWVQREQERWQVAIAPRDASNYTHSHPDGFTDEGGDHYCVWHGWLHSVTGPSMAWGAALSWRDADEYHVMGVHYKDKLAWAVAVAEFKQDNPDWEWDSEPK